MPITMTSTGYNEYILHPPLRVQNQYLIESDKGTDCKLQKEPVLDMFAKAAIKWATKKS